MDTTTTFEEQANQESDIVKRAREGLESCYDGPKIEQMSADEALRLWEKLVLAKSDTYVRARGHFF